MKAQVPRQCKKTFWYFSREASKQSKGKILEGGCSHYNSIQINGIV